MRVPEVHHGVCAERAPALGSLEDVLRRRRQPERLEPSPDAEVGREERVGIVEATHRDVVEGPGTDARHVGHRRERRFLVREVHGVRRDELAEPTDRVGSPARHPELLGSDLCHALGGWERV